MRVSNTELVLLSGMMLAEYRKTGKRTLGIPEARRRLEMRGYTLGGVSNGHLSHVLREPSLDVRARIAQVKGHAGDRQSQGCVMRWAAAIISPVRRLAQFRSERRIPGIAESFM